MCFLTLWIFLYKHDEMFKEETTGILNYNLRLNLDDFNLIVRAYFILLCMELHLIFHCFKLYTKVIYATSEKFIIGRK